MNKLYHLRKLSIELKVLNRINMFFRLLTCWSLFQKPPLGSPECPLVIWRPEKAITFTLTCTTYTKPFFKYIYIYIYKISTNYFITLKVLHCYINKCYIDGRFRQQSAFKNIIFFPYIHKSYTDGQFFKQQAAFSLQKNPQKTYFVSWGGNSLLNGQDSCT